MLRRAAALPALAALTLAACAEAPPPEAPPQPQATSAPMSPPIFLEPKGSSPVDQEMLAIAKAEDEIDKLFPHAGKAKESLKKGDAKPADKPAKDEAQALSGTTGDACAVACRALASMTTSAEHLCKLAGEADGRCEDARGRVRGAGARVHEMCPACNAGAK